MTAPDPREVTCAMLLDPEAWRRHDYSAMSERRARILSTQVVARQLLALDHARNLLAVADAVQGAVDGVSGLMQQFESLPEEVRSLVLRIAPKVEPDPWTPEQLESVRRIRAIADEKLGRTRRT